MKKVRFKIRENFQGNDPTNLGEMKANFRSLCLLRADLSGLRHSLSPRRHETNGVFYDVQYSIAIFFGTTSLKARLKWNEAVGFVP